MEIPHETHGLHGWVERQLAHTGTEGWKAFSRQSEWLRQQELTTHLSLMWHVRLRMDEVIHHPEARTEPGRKILDTHVHSQSKEIATRSTVRTEEYLRAEGTMNRSLGLTLARNHMAKMHELMLIAKQLVESPRMNDIPGIQATVEEPSTLYWHPEKTMEDWLQEALAQCNALSLQPEFLQTPESHSALRTIITIIKVMRGQLMEHTSPADRHLPVIRKTAMQMEAAMGNEPYVSAFNLSDNKNRRMLIKSMLQSKEEALEALHVIAKLNGAQALPPVLTQSYPLSLEDDEA